MTFSADYTFAAEDLAAGKVTFTAVAYVQNVREAFPPDNILSAPPPFVTR